jgi:hypothetical protein
MQVIPAFRTTPGPGTPEGDRVRQNFIADLFGILGDVRLLWLPGLGDTTTTTDKSRNARVFTYSESLASFDTPPGTQGSGVAVTFNGTDEEADVPDNDDFSFGDGAVDQPFSIVALLEADDATPTAIANILARWDKDTDGELREWRFFLTATNGYPTLELYDESANAYIGRQDQTALTANTFTLLIATYDGSGASTGINIYVDAVVLDDADSASGSYVAMENLADKVLLAHGLSAAATPVAEEFWAGQMGLVALCAKELSTDEAWEIRELMNAFFDLSL